MKKENLPSIYDDFNHLEVTEYVDEIYQYYWVLEVILSYTVIFFCFMVGMCFRHDCVGEIGMITFACDITTNISSLYPTVELACI